MSNPFSKVWYIDTQDEYLPKAVKEDVAKIWTEYDLGNDHYFYEYTLKQSYQSYPHLDAFIKKHIPNLAYDDKVLIHYWW